MKTVGVLLTLLMITVASEAGGRKKLKGKIDDLAKSVKTLIETKDDIKDKVDALTTKVDTMIQKNDPFVKLNLEPVCFGTKGGSFGSFEALAGGDLMKIKLVHLYGYVSCYTTSPHFWSYWGCGYWAQAREDHPLLAEYGITDWVIVSVTDQANIELFPPKEINRGDAYWALIPGYNSGSPELVMSIYQTPVKITAGQQLRLWYTEDLRDSYEINNHGRVCADVYGYFM